MSLVGRQGRNHLWSHFGLMCSQMLCSPRQSSSVLHLLGEDKANKHSFSHFWIHVRVLIKREIMTN